MDTVAQPPTPTRELRALLREIDPDRIEATVRELVSFGTCHTRSSQDDPDRGPDRGIDPGRGIGTARWDG